MTKKNILNRLSYIRWTSLLAIVVLTVIIVLFYKLFPIVIEYARDQGWQFVIDSLDKCSSDNFVDNKAAFACALFEGFLIMFNMFIWALILLYPVMVMIKLVIRKINLVDVVITQIYIFLLMPLNFHLAKFFIYNNVESLTETSLSSGIRTIGIVNLILFIVFLFKVEKFFLRNRSASL